MTSEEFKQARADMRLTQTELAVLIGVTQGELSCIESTRKPTRFHRALINSLKILARHDLLHEYKAEMGV